MYSLHISFHFPNYLWYCHAAQGSTALGVGALECVVVIAMHTSLSYHTMGIHDSGVSLLKALAMAALAMR